MQFKRADLSRHVGVVEKEKKTAKRERGNGQEIWSLIKNGRRDRKQNKLTECEGTRLNYRKARRGEEGRGKREARRRKRWVRERIDCGKNRYKIRERVRGDTDKVR